MKNTVAKSEIVMHTAKSKWDILRTGGWTYIIRNDLEASYYMKLDGLNDTKPEADVLWNGMKRGLHYAGYYKDGTHYKYAIDSTQYWRVSNIKFGPINAKRNLHPDYIGRDHYFERGGNWYGVDVKNSKYWTNKGGYSKKAKKRSMRSDIKAMNPIAMWANGDYYYVLTMDSYNDLVVKRTKDLRHRWKSWTNQYLSSAMISFLPGGISNLHGSAAARWHYVDGFLNSNSENTQTFTHTRKVSQGYDSEVVKSLEKNWELSQTTKNKTSVGIGIASLKQSMSFSAKYGGSEINTNSSAWAVSVKDDSTISMIAPAGKRVDLFQAIVSNGDLGTVLYGPWTTTYGSGDIPVMPKEDPKKQFLREPI